MLAVLDFPNIGPNAIAIGPVAIKWYGLAYVAALLFASWYMKRLAANSNLWGNLKLTMNALQIDNMFIWFFLGVVGGGRLGYVLFYNFPKYLVAPLDIFKVWDGGMSFHGGFLGVVIACYFYGRHIGMGLDRMLDMGAASVPVGLGLGRVANFINAELYGRASDLPWAVIFPGENFGRHPSQLYEALLEGLVLFLCVRIGTHKYQALAHPGGLPEYSHWAMGWRESLLNIFACLIRSSDICLASLPWAWFCRCRWCLLAFGYCGVRGIHDKA